MHWAAGEVAAAAGGELVAGAPETPIRGFSIDTRALLPDQCFLPLAGTRTDGHAFLDQAVERGAAAVLIGAGRPELEAGLIARGRAQGRAVAVIRVDDVHTALVRLGRARLARVAPLVAAVTGSVGKTTTKEMLAAIFGQVRRVQASPGNYNTEIGLPLTLVELEPGTEVLVVELGMRGAGEIRRLARIASPRLGVVTRIGESHMELLGSLEAIAGAKGELVEELPPDGVAILNADDPRVAALARRTRARVITYGLAGGQVRATRLRPEGEGGTTFLLHWEGGRLPVHLPVPGRHMVENAAAAAACALAAGVEPEAIARGLAGFRGAPMRVQLCRTAEDILVINDAYNASPPSVRAALETLAELARHRPGRKVAVLGEMRELGPASVPAHAAVGRQAARVCDLLVLVGDRMEPACREAAAVLPGGCLYPVPDAGAATAVVREIVRPGDTVLVKGSRAVGLEAVARSLLGERLP